ncbi:hypothetical protein [Cohaesibacter celericrescens]|uniref:Uncharacterized protein n=1 Tax=Cohaesibacter celericrescens TaxID=2067669 RepID=A0A2N5XTV0_9HYPH|nr:hypothetical protein [Cohaesibacter celericrescens]PLW77875.1 hypothetical protein C0081_07045 [Cohaesibacter celericrescens]
MKSFFVGMLGGLIVVLCATFAYSWFGAHRFLEVWDANSGWAAAIVGVFVGLTTLRPLIQQAQTPRIHAKVDAIEKEVRNLTELSGKIEQAIFECDVIPNLRTGKDDFETYRVPTINVNDFFNTPEKISRSDNVISVIGRFYCAIDEYKKNYYKFSEVEDIDVSTDEMYPWITVFNNTYKHDTGKFSQCFNERNDDFRKISKTIRFAYTTAARSYARISKLEKLAVKTRARLYID